MQKPNKPNPRIKKDHTDGKTSATATKIRRWDRAATIALASLRRDRDQTQLELAALLGLERQMIANLEARRRPIGFGEVMVLAQALGTTPAQILELITLYFRSAPREKAPGGSRLRRCGG